MVVGVDSIATGSSDEGRELGRSGLGPPFVDGDVGGDDDISAVELDVVVFDFDIEGPFVADSVEDFEWDLPAGKLVDEDGVLLLVSVPPELASFASWECKTV